MPEIVWPPTLPQVALADGYTSRPGDNVVRTEMDVGPAKVRRRGSAGVRRISVRYRMTPAQSDDFEAFYNDTLRSGALRFTWPGPAGGDSLTARILPTPVWRPRGANWTVSMDLEILP